MTLVGIYIRDVKIGDQVLGLGGEPVKITQIIKPKESRTMFIHWLCNGVKGSHALHPRSRVLKVVATHLISS